MARRGKWDNELCAEHDGTVATFDNLDIKLHDITDYGEIFKRKSINIQKVATITAIAIGGAAVIGPVAYAAAPAIGGAIGTSVMGLSGAAATNAGLAAIGGGALATGGLGMAGGAAILAATGAALGGVAGSVISNSYFQDVEGFKIELFKSGYGPKVLCIDGFLTENNPDPVDWKRSLSSIYPNNPWYYVRWECKRLYDIGKNLSSHGGKAAAQKLIYEWSKSASKEAAKKLGPLGCLMTVLGIATNSWSIALVKAGQTGILLADLIARTHSEYILVGHSLGARVVYYTIKTLQTKSEKFIRDIHVMGGAVGSCAQDWQQVLPAINGVMANYYSLNDWVLATLYKTGTFFASCPIGRNPIDLNAVANRDVSSHVQGHTLYKENFHKFCI